MDVDNTNLIQHKIHTIDEIPVVTFGRKKSPQENQYINEEVQRMLNAGIIEPSKSSYSTPVVLVKKKNGSKLFHIRT